jgi:hypothetical protein
LTDYEYYIIYPQYSQEIEKIIQIKFSIIPDNILRMFYVLQGTNDNQKELSAPVIPSFNRNGFVATEWGVVINDKSPNSFLQLPKADKQNEGR